MKKLLGVFGVLLLLGACGTENEKTKAWWTAHSEIDWVDFVMIQDELYESYDTAVLSAEDWVGDEMGQVDFKVADQVTNPNYRVKNGDAAFWEAGTIIYAVKGMPGMAAVADDTEVNGYRVYATRDALSDLEVHPKDVNFDAVESVEFHKGYVTTDLVNTLSEPDKIDQLLELLDAGEIDSMYTPSEEDGDPVYYRMIFYREGAIAHKFNLFDDGKNWFWHPWDTEVLPMEIGELVIEHK